MAENFNLIKLQGILQNISNIKGDLSKIKYKAGNQSVITEILEELKAYLQDKELVEDGKCNPNHEGGLNNVLQLLLTNTALKTNKQITDMQRYSHFSKAIPTISKCIFANIVVELNLMEYFCTIIQSLPLVYTEELLSEMITIIRNREPTKSLTDTLMILEAIVICLTVKNEIGQDWEVADKICDVALELLNTLPKLNAEWAKKWKLNQINIHMGYTLLGLLKLLQKCPLHMDNLTRLISSTIQVTTSVMEAVNVLVFCAWAEVNYDNGQPLQIVVANEAYQVIEHLQKYKPAKELNQMLRSIARKPKTLQEIILEANTATIIDNINKCDQNQKLWFRALLNSNILENKNAVECIDRWAQLSSQGDIMRLLSMNSYHKDQKAKKLILKCAHCLELHELEFTLSSYFRGQNITNLELPSFKDDFICLLNKINYNEDCIKDIYLLLLQNREMTILTLYQECLKQSTQTSSLKTIFKRLKLILEIDNTSSIVLRKFILENPPYLNATEYFRDFLNMLLELKYFDENFIITQLFLTLLNKFISENNCELVFPTLKLLLLINIKYAVNQESLQFISILARVIEYSRFQFFTFSTLKQNITQEVVNILLKYIVATEKTNAEQLKGFVCNLNLKSNINKYYFISLYEDRQSILDFIYPKYKEDDSTHVLVHLLNILPSCVSSEWKCIWKKIKINRGYQETLLLLENFITLLCQTANPQGNNSDKPSHSGLKFCLQQIGIIVKDIFLSKENTVTEEIIIAKTVCNFLADLPTDLKKQEGLQLTTLMSQQALQSLKDDKEFLVSLVAIQDSTIMQIIAQKML